MSEGPRFAVGIDLGTSNTALAYADLTEGPRPEIRVFEVPQLVAPSDVQLRPLLPSALYDPASFEFSADATALPWRPAGASPELVVGLAARRLGAKTAVRYVESAKSWLCHGGVNRSAKILPWHAPDDVPKRSPVEASAAFLAHLRSAWDHEFARKEPALALEHQDIVVTVPASFDEVSRKLTLEAAVMAGLPQVSLLEEPMAAFYAFVARTGGTPQATGLKGGERILIADVGGGTSDFTLIEVQPPADGQSTLRFDRTAVGEHLLLGGDNMDLALAHALESDLSQGKKLDAEQWAQLKLESRLAKETLFSHPDRDDLPIVIAGKGSKLIGGSRRAVLSRKTLETVVVNGYFPELPPGAQARPRIARTAGLTEYGLPYATDPAITRHLAAFLMRHRGEAVAADVDAILFNGGALKPPAVRERLCSVLGNWLRSTLEHGRPDPRPLVYDEGDAALELAVAQGASYFALVRRGLGQRIGGGSPRTYFLGVDAGEDARSEDQVKLLCIAPRGMQDGQQVEVPEREFQLVTNRPVAFPLYSSTSPREEAVGDLGFVSKEELHELPPLKTVVRFGKQKAGTRVPVRLQARRTEVGTLEVSCFSRMSGARFRLEFDLRAAEAVTAEAEAHAKSGPEAEPSKAGGGEGGVGPVPDGTPAPPAPDPLPGSGAAPPPEEGDVEPERQEAAKAEIDATFEGDAPPASLMKRLETALDLGRNEIPLPVLRFLAEHLLEKMGLRGRTPEHEARWLNVVGFCLRPGFGSAMDAWRVRQLWKIHGPGLQHPSHAASELNWWILWRRVSGGLGRGPQEELNSRVSPLLVPALHKRAKKKPPRPKSEEAAEMWRAAASLERLSAKARAQLGDALLDVLESNKAPKGALWCMSRLGSRRLLYGPKEVTVRPGVASRWIDRLLALPKPPKDGSIPDTVLALARMCGDRQLDLDEDRRQALDVELAQRGLSDDRRRALFDVVGTDRAAQGAAYGDDLPLGLALDP